MFTRKTPARQLAIEERNRLMLDAHEQDGLTEEYLSETAGISVKSVKAALDQARKQREVERKYAAQFKQGELALADFVTVFDTLEVPAKLHVVAKLRDEFKGWF